MTFAEMDKVRLLAKGLRFPAALLLAVVLLSGCVKHVAEAGGGILDCVVTNPTQVEVFSDGLKAKLVSEGFTRSQPLSGFVASAGLRPGADNEVYWFKGSYRGAPTFYLKMVQDGHRRECFHLSYYWEVVAYNSPQKEMNDEMLTFHRMLAGWAADGKLVYLPPAAS